MERNKRLFEKSLKDYTILFLIIMLLIAVILVFVRNIFGSYTFEDFVNDFFNSLMGAIIPLIIFNILFEYLMRTHQSKVVQESIAETLLMKEEVLTQFSEDNRKEFLKNTAQSLVGKDEGEMLYSTLFVPYLSKSRNFRRNFKYYIFYTPEDKMRDLDQGARDLFPASDYVWVIEDLSYEKNVIRLEDELLVGFSYNEQQLESYFKNSRIVFRENLFLHEAQIQQMRAMEEAKLTEFVERSMQFAMEVNGVKLKVKGVIHENGGFVLRLDAQEAKFAEDGSYNRLKVNFRMPQMKAKKQFILVISEPTYGVDILFSNQLEQMNVSAVPFFDQDEIVESLPNDLTKIQLSSWVLPTSGVVFVWEEKQAALRAVDNVEEEASRAS
ncbi:hypothetical protein FHS18_005326 [Paenibacillus phyllosphaerae]|uniref:Uncharacterized protein n=1 Tax=Paenibacillus phyllosphaerae TaxID=274593 RepID=A0A7W5B2I5_9BACL|nr:hypothetical protein [Paenibacillus phyllosphaerae]MBB3113223.1 hypothetical protein [Paenibacillus phyllosphaerae]